MQFSVYKERIFKSALSRLE